MRAISFDLPCCGQLFRVGGLFGTPEDDKKPTFNEIAMIAKMRYHVCGNFYL